MRNNVFKTFHSGQAVFFLMLFICFIFAGAVLKLASIVFLPLTIAALLASAMYPLVRVLDKIKIPRFISILLVVIIIVTGLYFFGMILFSSGRMIAAQYPKYEYRLTEIYVWIANLFELPYDQDLSFGANLWGQLGIRNWVRNFTFSLSNSVVSFVSEAVIVVLFVVFILMEANYFKDKLDTAFENRSARINKIGHDVMSQVTRYLTAKFLISLANGLIYAISFSIVKLEFAFVWGVIQFLLNFIPNLGSIVAGVVISLFAFIQFWPDPTPVIIVISIILAVNLILSNIFDPKIIGDHVGISPLMILVSLAIWGWIWGFAGMVLAVPMTVIIKIVCENIPIMEPVSIILGSKKSVLTKKLEKEKQEP